MQQHMHMLKDDITGLILAGGRARRMGGIDKGLVELGSKPMISHVLERLTPQVGRVMINANRNLDTYQEWTQTVIRDSTGEYDGPLAGMASGLEVTTTRYMLTCPCDSPLLADDLAVRMYKRSLESKAEVAVASDGCRLHPVFLLIHRNLLPSILAFLETGERKIDKWFEQHNFCVVDFADKPESFLNVNTLFEKQELASRFDFND